MVQERQITLFIGWKRIDLRVHSRLKPTTRSKLGWFGDLSSHFDDLS